MSNLKMKLISKIENNKIEKKEKLLNSAYYLFTNKGINNTSIQDIVNNAGIGKGTFYLYFKNKYNIQEQLIINKSYDLFKNALEELKKNYINDFEDQIIFVINYVIDELIKDPTLINFITKDLSLGFYSDSITKMITDNNEIGIFDTFIKGIKENNIKIKNPEVTLFMIIELVSSTCFRSITMKSPLPIDEYKPYLYEEIRKMLRN